MVAKSFLARFSCSRLLYHSSSLLAQVVIAAYLGTSLIRATDEKVTTFVFGVVALVVLVDLDMFTMNNELSHASMGC